MTDERAAGNAIKSAVDAFGRLDVLVNNTGYGDVGSIEDTSLADFAGSSTTLRNSRPEYDSTVGGLVQYQRDHNGTQAGDPIWAIAQNVYGMTGFRTVLIDGLDIFYREAGSRSNPTILLLHGFPTSSHMFRNLIPALADRFHLVAPDYPGFGYSAMPTVDEFDYTFDRLAEVMAGFIAAIGLNRYSLYLMDYGAPIGYRLATQHPERVEALIVQNGNAYEEGLGDFWKPMRAYWQNKTPENADRVRQSMTVDATKRYYTTGAKNLENLCPDTWTLDQAFLDRPGNLDIQLALKYDYHSNVLLYPQWQAYFRQYQPPTLVVWGKNDRGFLVEGAYAYKRDLQNLEFHLFDTGHFALEEEGEAIANYIAQFLTSRLQPIPV